MTLSMENTEEHHSKPLAHTGNCVVSVMFLGSLQMNPGLVKWTVFWLENFRMEPDLVNWTEFCMEGTISCESGVVEGFSLGKFKMEQGLMIWK